MITKVQIKTGFMLQSPCIAGKVIEFKPGLNIIVGDNGSFKSSLLKTIAAYCGIEKGGFSEISDPAKLGSASIGHFPYVYHRYAPGKTHAAVEWDGTASFYNDSDMLAKNDLSWFLNPKHSLDGITTEQEQLEIMTNHPSSGQYRISKINKIMEMLKSVPDLTQGLPLFFKSLSTETQKAAMAEVEYIKSLPRNGAPTVLLDEPEKALSLAKQLELFDTIENLAKYFQVIMVSHSPFVLFKKKAHYIDMIPDFAKTNKDLIKKYLK